MSIKVLVVDDSSFFRRRVAEIVNAAPNVEVVGFASNGQEAIDQAVALRPNVITMDIEMPVLDGISAVKQIMSKAPTAILMFSSLTQEGAKATLDALDAGAADFLSKRFEEIARDRGEAVKQLQQKVIELGRRPVRRPFVTSRPTPVAKSMVPERSTPSRSPATSSLQQRSVSTPARPAGRASGKQYKLLAIGTSTGGPVALQKVITQLPQRFPYPIILIQHMPAAFTPAFASRLDALSQIKVKEAVDGEKLSAGVAYLAPGGKQMTVDGTASNARIRIFEEQSDRVTYKPSVDISFGSAAKVFAGDVLGIILTGMGADGREGSRMLKQRGARIWAQDEQSCVVYGMPQAIVSAGIAEKSIALDQVSTEILTEMKH